MSEPVLKSIKDLDWASLTRRTFYPSPEAWEDQVLYFLMLDRFSDGREHGGYRDASDRPVTTGTTPLYTAAEPNRVDYHTWFTAGEFWQGGTFNGVRGKLGYLRRLGVTALWISPILKQTAFVIDTYHGYGTQNFLAVDPHYGTSEDFRELVQAAHEQGLYVILDVVLNHAGNVYSYTPDRYWTQNPKTGEWFMDPRWDGHTYPFKAFHDQHGQPVFPFDLTNHSALDSAWPDGAVWPIELQTPWVFRRKGRIVNWDYFPEFVQGDFNHLKGIDLGDAAAVEHFKPSDALLTLTAIYQYWIAYADLDGLRIDSVKHMGAGPTRWFCSAIREFTQTIGKERFLLIGEVAGPREQALNTVELTGLDAGLGLADIPDKLVALAKGYGDPNEYFVLFRNSEALSRSSHAWFRGKVVTMLDDHDQVHNGQRKGRFCVDEGHRDLLFNAMALNLTTMGIPCIYYGTEQAFDSGGRINADDRVLRENMFGGQFGSFCTQDRHFFNEDTELFRAISQLIDIRKQCICLRRGRQYLLPISSDGENFELPRHTKPPSGLVICWSRIYSSRGALLALNTDPHEARSVYVAIVPDQYLSHVADPLKTMIPDQYLHLVGDQLKCIYWHSPRKSAAPPPLITVGVVAGRKVVQLTVPPNGFVIYE